MPINGNLHHNITERNRIVEFGDSRVEKFFWNRLSIAVNGCWEFAYINKITGYGRTKIKGKATYPHRHLYSKLVSEIPAGFVIDHLCRNRRCANPTHLESVTQMQNIQRGLRGTKRFCIRGHEFVAGNFKDYGRDGKQKRLCIKCRNINKAAYEFRAKNGLVVPGKRVPKKTHCIKGHELSEENLCFYFRFGRKTRTCKTCHRDRERVRREKRREAKNGK